VSLGKARFTLNSRIEVGLVKVDSFMRSDSKLGCAYLSTPMGITEKAAVTARLLARERHDYKPLER
jgi:hypothetical protein